MFKNKEGKIRSGWKIAGVTGTFFGIYLVISGIIGMILGVFLMTRGYLDFKTMEYSEKGMEILHNFEIIGMIIMEILIIITPIIAWKFIMKRPLSNMGLRSFKSHSKELLVGLLFGAISITLVFGAMLISNNAVVTSWKPQFSSDTILYLVIFILVGLAEEIYGRGFIMSALRQTKNKWVVVIVSSVFFALLHSGSSGIGIIPYINLTLVGVLFAYMYLKSGNIWMPIGYHITWNYFQGNVFGFKVSGLNTKGIFTTTYETNNILNGGEFGPEGGILVTAIILLGFIYVNRFYENSTFDFMSAEPETKIPVQEQEAFIN